MNSKTRNLLALGASALAIGVSTPAFAGVTTEPGVLQSYTAIPLGSVQGTLEIGNIGEVGRYDIDLNEADSIGIAIVDDVSRGRVEQSLDATAILSRDATGKITNGPLGYAEVAAVGVGTGDTGGYGRAELYSAFQQSANANRDASLTLANDGEISALAFASGEADRYATGSGGYLYFDAGADAYQWAGIDQYASGGRSGSVSLQNSSTGGITISSVALAHSRGEDAYATSGLEDAIRQQAYGDAASVELGNAGEITIGGLARAYGDTSARASQNIWDGIYQYADGVTASVDLNNADVISISGSATAEAWGYAEAHQRINNAIRQVANGHDEGTVSLSNSGSVDILGKAYASAHSAYADAAVNGIVQYASAAGADANASASLMNDGAISVDAEARAYSDHAHAGARVAGINQQAEGYNGASAAVLAENNSTIDIGVAAAAGAYTDAHANAYLDYGINQFGYSSGGNASVTLTSNGEINATAAAHAHAGEDANATATAQYAVEQYASVEDAGGLAAATLTNAGTISVGAAATAGAFDTVHANAQVRDAISQGAQSDGAAAVELTNSGTIEANAYANASANNSAFAVAEVYRAIDQYAYGFDGAAANATLTNDVGGLISVNATASASAGGLAQAGAYVGDAIRQRVYAADGGDANALLDNSGSIEVNANAYGSADRGYVYADMRRAISQYAYATNSSATSGNASVALTNSATGSISLLAAAVATSLEVNGGTSDASVYANQAIYQYAGSDDGSASVAVANDGSIDIGIHAYSDGTDANTNARAYGYLANAIYQSAYAAGGVTEHGASLAASVTLDNTGDISISAAVTASGTYDAYAWGKIATGINQYAEGRNGSDAIVGLTNAASGTISISADVNAIGVDSSANYAYAYVEHAIAQGADAYDGAAATVSLTNSGAVSVSADAYAYGTSGYAKATASVQDYAIGQFAYAAGGGDATATLGNTGSIHVTGSAEARGDHAFALGYAENALYQGAVADNSSEVASGNASLMLTNSVHGVIDLQGAAHAYASTGNATATGKAWGGVWQSAVSHNGAATAEIVNDGSINISAVAFASANAARAYANGDLSYGIGNSAYANNGGDATASIVNTGSVNVSAEGVAIGATSSAAATAQAYYGIGQFVGATDGGAATAEITNSGTVAFSAHATGSGSYGTARAYADYAIYQSAEAHGHATTGGANASGNASVVLTNASDGVISVSANAKGIGNRTGEDTDNYYASWSYGQAKGAFQTAYSDDGDASTIITNNGLFEIAVNANSTPAEQDAFAQAEVYGVEQHARTYGDTGLASNLFTNVGDLTIDANATAAAQVNYGKAIVTAHYALLQQANAYGEDGTAANTLNNSGSVTVNSNAVASLEADDTYGTAYASASGYLVHQRAEGTTALSAITNSGALTTNVTADAAGHDLGKAYAWNYAIFQDAFGLSATASVDNKKTGVINSLAQATGAGVDAVATASAWGIDQTTWGLDPVMTLTNAGTITTKSVAKAVGSDHAVANAYAFNVYQDSDYDSSYVLANSGTMTAEVRADATGSVANASGSAWNYIGRGHGSSNVDLALTNSGTMSATAKVNSDGSAYANIGSIWVDGGSISGTLTNSSKITVDAEVNGATEAAYAYGIGMDALSNGATINNSGTIKVSAKGHEGAALHAYGIAVYGATGTTSGSPNTSSISTQVATALTINNTGTIIVRQSTDNGATWQHGTAIDLTDAPNAAVVNLKGGSIYGNIELSNDDVINVSTAVTNFDGQVNSGGNLVGTLNILAGGTLYMQDEPTANTSYDGASKVNVNALNIAGTLALQLPSLPTTVGSYPSLVANTANITGATLQLRPSSSNGLYANSYTFDNVIDAETLTGKFATVTTLSGTPLLRFTAIYDNQNNVDLTMTRVAFGAVGGLTTNQSAAGSGIERIYSPTMAAGPFATMLGTLFTMNTANYTSALEQLHGSQYASYLQSLTSVGGRFNTMLGDVAECAASEVTKACRAESGGIWGKISYGRTTKDGDVNAPAYKSNDWFMAVGADFKASKALVLGVAGAYVKNDLKFDRFAGRINADGFQVGGYAAYDPGQYFLKAAVSYSSLNGEAQRTIAIPSVASGTLTASPDVNAWTVSGQFGYRLPLGKASVLTPYAGVEYTAAKLKAFDEAGVAVANLAVADSDHNRTASLAGVKWTGTFGKIVPQIDLGWRHQFGDLTASVLQSYKIAAGSNFTAISQTEKADTAQVGVSLGGEIGKGISLRVGYQGRFNGDVESHSGGITLTAKLGGGN